MPTRLKSGRHWEVVAMSYALSTLWHERQRFFPGVLAVAFSALLIALQCGLLLGLFSITSIPIDHSQADIWMCHPKIPSVDLGLSIPESWSAYLSQPEIERTEVYMEGFAYWSKPTGGMELSIIIGSRMSADALGAIKQLSPLHRQILSEYMTVVIDRGEFERLGVSKVGEYAEINKQKVRIVGTVKGLRSLAGPYVFCSVETAKRILPTPPKHVSFVLAKCKNKNDAPAVVDRLNAHQRKIAYDDRVKVEVYTQDQFSFRSRWHWLTKTKAGIALGLAAGLGLLVGAVVTSQTLYAATAASMREYAVLRALGIPRWRMCMTVLAQSFWVGVIGVIFAVPGIYGLAYLGSELGAKVQLPWQVMALAVTITMVMAMVSGLMALRSLRDVEPVTLLR
jgi:putative ABC transport system permease protein